MVCSFFRRLRRCRSNFKANGSLSPQLTAFLTSGDLSFFGGGQLFQRRRSATWRSSSRFASCMKPNVAYLVLNFRAALEEADDLTVLGIRGHAVPEPRRQGQCSGFDDRRSCSQGDLFRHGGDVREHGAFPDRLVCARARARGRLLRGALGDSGFIVIFRCLSYSFSYSPPDHRNSGTISVCGLPPAHVYFTASRPRRRLRRLRTPNSLR